MLQKCVSACFFSAMKQNENAASKYFFLTVFSG